jgi:hypothetical protein
LLRWKDIASFHVSAAPSWHLVLDGRGDHAAGTDVITTWRAMLSEQATVLPSAGLQRKQPQLAPAGVYSVCRIFCSRERHAWHLTL